MLLSNPPDKLLEKNLAQFQARSKAGFPRSTLALGYNTN